jgi:hypothetical protein
MMVYVLLVIVILLLPFPADAAYKISLRNGSVITGVSSYEKNNGEVTIYFGGGSMGVSQKDILKIEETGASEQDFRTPEVSGGQREAPPATPSGADTGNRDARRDALQAQLDSVNSEIQATEEEEARILKAINDRKGSRLTYNSLQLRQLDSDLAPLQQELSNIQVKKGALSQKKTIIENEMQGLQ